MPWQYQQSTGELSLHNQIVARNGYSGFEQGKDNPQLEAVRNIGPIPRGRYAIGPAHQHPGKGPMVMSLTPVGHLAQGRTHFLIHGESRDHPGQASHGCIILGLSYRQRIAGSGETILEVVR
jgi:hypothetical protein